MTSQTLIKTQQLSIGYHSKGRTWMINLPDFEIKTSQLIGILGANGAGKSTLLKTLSGQINTLKGDVLYDHKNLKLLNNEARAQLFSVVLTERLPNSQLTVEQLVSMGRYPYVNWQAKLTQADEALVQQVIEQLDLSTLTHHRISELSDGQLQRVMIARCLAQQTPLIFLDEPTSHLDLVYKIKIFRLMKSLVKNHQKTVIFSSHELNLCLQFCDQMMVFTPKEFYFDRVEHLKTQKVFDALFADDAVRFDEKDNLFKLIE